MKNIVIFTIAPINQDFLKRYGYYFFKDNDVEVIFYNLCNLIYGPKKAFDLGYNNLGRISYVKELKIISYKQLYFLLKKYREDTIVYFNISANPILLLILLINKVPYIDGSPWGGIQTQDWIKGNPLLTLFNKFKKYLKQPIHKTKRKISSYFSNFFSYLHPSIFRLTSNSIELSIHREKNTDNSLLLNHTFDYDRYLTNSHMDKPSYIPEHQYYLLLPNHAWMIHDYIINDAEKDCVITKEKYEKLINKTLDDIESLTGRKILIAGYPVASKDEDIYKNRDFLLGTETEQLVKYSSGIITHFSGAINFAIIHKKPICIINYKVFDDDPRFYGPIKAYSKYLDAPINYVDNSKDLKNIEPNKLFVFNEEKFQEYFYEYICPKQLHVKNPELFWERVLNKLKN